MGQLPFDGVEDSAAVSGGAGSTFKTGAFNRSATPPVCGFRVLLRGRVSSIASCAPSAVGLAWDAKCPAQVLRDTQAWTGRSGGRHTSSSRAAARLSTAPSTNAGPYVPNAS
jgi:hypothetical protein